MGFFRRFWPLLLLALVPLLPLHRAVFLGEAIGPWDHIRTMQPWSEPAPDEPWDVLQADACLQFMPWRHLVFEAYRNGEFPFWNPYELCGTPLLANSQSGGFYPPHVLLGVARVPDVPAVTLLAWFHLFVAGWGCFRLVQLLGGSEVGGAFAGISFQLSAFSLAWVGLASVPSTVAWIPWVLAGVLRFSVEGKSNVSDPSHLSNLLKLSAAVAMMLLAGHLQFAAYGCLAAGVFWLALLVGKRPSWRLLMPLAGIVLGAMLAAPQVIPVLEHSKFSHRANRPSEDGFRSYSLSAVQLFELAALPAPMILGNPREWSPKVEGVSAYWPALTKPGANFAETALGVGPLILTLLCFAPFRRKNVLAIAAVGVFGLLATGTFVSRFLYFGIPGWSASGSPGRAAVLFILVACVLAGLSIHQVVLKRSLALLALLTPLFFASGALLLLQIAANQFEGSINFRPVIFGTLAEVWPGIAVSIVVAGIAAYLLSTGKYRALSAVAVPFALLTSLVIGLGLFVPTGQMPDFPEDVRTSIVSSKGRTVFINDKWSLFKTPEAVMPPNLSALYGIREVAGYDSLTDRRSVFLLEKLNGQNPSPPENGNMMLTKSTLLGGQLAEFGVAVVWSGSMPGLPLAERVLFDGEYKFIQDGLTRVEIETTGAGTLILRDMNAEGWTATVDGKVTPLADSTWREVEVPDGKHNIGFTYFPPGLRSGLILFGIATFALLLMFGFEKRKRKTANRQPPTANSHVTNSPPTEQHG